MKHPLKHWYSVGHDLRLRPEAIEPWPKARRATYLLRQDVKAVLSVDAQVWPSVIPEGSDWRGPFGIWQDFSTLQAAAGDSNADGWWVEIAMHERDVARVASCELKPMGSVTRRKPLGYDVADAYLLSGLSNCSDPLDSRQVLVSTWATRLNEWHLFSDFDDAQAFAALSDGRIERHAPFFVFALFRVLKGLAPPSVDFRPPRRRSHTR